MMGVALLLRKFGSRCDGGYEVFVPYADIAEMPPHATVQEQPDQLKGGVWLRCFPNRTTDAGRLEHVACPGVTLPGVTEPAARCTCPVSGNDLPCALHGDGGRRW